MGEELAGQQGETKKEGVGGSELASVFRSAEETRSGPAGLWSALLWLRSKFWISVTRYTGPRRSANMVRDGQWRASIIYTDTSKSIDAI